MHILWFLLFGLVVGILARFIVPGREPGGWVISMLIGVGGAIVGGYFGRVVGSIEKDSRRASSCRCWPRFPWSSSTRRSSGVETERDRSHFTIREVTSSTCTPRSVPSARTTSSNRS